MIYEAEKVKELKIAYIGGGSRGWAWGLMADLAMEPLLSGTVCLYDIDENAAQNNALIGNHLSEREEAVAKWDYQVASTLQEALTGADFVVISILPGTFDEMESDVHAPESYGIYQSVGDTVGIGGHVRALRTIPMFAQIAEAIRDFAPQAWVINYTNPMTVCVKTLYTVFPRIKAFGCCHEVFGTQKLLCRVLEDICGIENVAKDEIDVNVLGINHFTWLDRASFKGMDLFPLYRQFVDKYHAEGYLKQVDDNWMNNYFMSAERVKMDLFQRYGLIAAAGDRHLAEFLPGSWYMNDPEMVREWKYGLTPVQFRKEELEKRLARSKRLKDGEEEIELKQTGEEGVHMIKALLGLEKLVTNVNVPNAGQISNLPLGAIVETNALFGKDYISPVMAGALPLDILHLVSRHVINQEALVPAAMAKDFESAFRIFLNDPQVRLTVADARALYIKMLNNTSVYLSGWQIPSC